MRAIISQGRSLTAAPLLQRSRGRLRLSAIRTSDGSTRVAELFQEGCLKVRMPRPRSDEEVDLAMLNIGGGLTGGDRLSVDLTVGAGARVTVTTPACERIYRSLGDDVLIDHHLRVGRGARLDWLPQETILFDQSRLRRRLDVQLEADAELTIAESVLFGRTAMGEIVSNGSYSDFWTVRRDGYLIFADALRIVGSAFKQVTDSPVVLGGRQAIASVIHAGRDLVCKRDALLAGFARSEEAIAGATVVGDLLVVKIVASGGGALRRALVPAIVCLREPHPLPRLWFC